MQTFKDLKIWQSGIDLVGYTYEIIRNFPERERFGLISQMTRAVVSVPSNIAEGYGRNSKKEFARFLDIALGSLYELETQLIISVRLGYLESFDENGIIRLKRSIIALKKSL
jgi:four helix bundle protein